MTLQNVKYLIPAALLFTGFSSCKLFTNGDVDTRKTVVIDKNREVQLDGNSGKMFDILTGKSTGIDFVNDLTDNYQVNWWRYTYIYNGGAVCIGDINNDGKPDLFFTGNLVPNRLYLNKGNLKFEDITEKSGINKLPWEWTYGASMVDVNGDGWLDIYVCLSRWDDPEKRRNRLFINNGDGTFTEKAKEMGLDDDTYSTMANFFDYDNDGDLDMYLASHPVDFIDKNKTKYFQKIETGKNNSDHFYINNGDGTFTESHLKVGINNHGYGLSCTVGDLNGDGYQDVYVANDFAMYDFIYMNNGDGTFRDESLKAIKKTSINAMGSEINDFNNDGFPDIMVTDMDMENNYTYKTFMLSSQVEVMRILINAGYGYQNRSNSLQLNNGDGTFSEISRSAGVSTTDWSWSDFFVDLDNDGYKDLFIANGFLRDFHVDESEAYHKLRRAVRINDSTVYYQVRNELPNYTLNHPNYVFKNNGDLTFDNMQDKWGIYYPSISYGAGYADLDGDGDIDIIVSNVNETPWIYRNNSDKLGNDNNWVDFHFKGYAKNSEGLGTKVRIYYGDKMQYMQHTLCHGYLTTEENDCHFGLGQNKTIDMVEVEWLDGSKQILTDVPADQVIMLDHANASKSVQFVNHNTTPKTFREATADLKTDFTHVENDYDDFLREFLIPQKMSTLGPGIAVGDVNGDGLDDFYVGGAQDQSGALFLQTKDGKFTHSNFQKTDDMHSEDAGALIFDADGDGDKDLYIATGGNEHEKGDPKYEDRFFRNDGKGNFTRDKSALPQFFTSSSVVTAADFDKDGDLDLFVGGRQVPGEYLASTSSYILRNDGGKFTDISSQVAPMLNNIGMVTSALWTDYDNDGQLDLLITGDWMPVTVLKNNNGKFTDATETSGLKNLSGWWQSITAADVDNDGDMDYIVGNFGTNRRYENTVSEKDGSPLPLEGYLNDFDNNGTQDFIMAYYQHDKLYPTKTRERMVEEIPSIADKFPTWDAYGRATLQEIFGEKALNESIHKTAYEFRSGVLINDGGKFTFKPLPNICQISVIFGMVVDDFNEDGYPDVLLQGNFYNTEIEVTRHDAGTGVLLLGDGSGNFTPERSYISGFKNDMDAKALATLLLGKNNAPVFLASNSNGPLLSFEQIKYNNDIMALADNDAYAIITMKDGSKQKKELYMGSGYISQSAKYVRITPQVASVEVYNYQGNARTVYPSTTAMK